MYCRAITSSDAIHWAPKWLIISSSLKWPKLLLCWLQREGTARRGGSAQGTRTTRERREEGRRGRLCEDGGWSEKGGRYSDHRGIENSTVFLARGKVSTRCWKLKKKKLAAADQLILPCSLMSSCDVVRLSLENPSVIFAEFHFIMKED